VLRKSFFIVISVLSNSIFFVLFFFLPVETDDEDGVNVRFMKKTGGHYVGPNVNDLSLVFLGKILIILPTPHSDGCGRYFF